MTFRKAASEHGAGEAGEVPGSTTTANPATLQGTNGSRQADDSRWAIPVPSPAYRIAEELEKQEAKPSKTIPPGLLKEMQKWREEIVQWQEEQQQEDQQRQARYSHVPEAPEPPRDCPYTITITEAGSGYKKPQLGDTVRTGYVVALKEDGSIIDSRPDFEYRLGGGERGLGEVTHTSLEWALVQLRRGEVASVSCTLNDLFIAGAPALTEHGSEARAVLEVGLFEILSTKDCSFFKGAGEIVKEVIKEGIGAWCDNPTDEGSAMLRIEEIRSANGARIFPLDGAGPVEVLVTPGNGKVCDALECAMLEMRQHETALVTCRDPSMCIGSVPQVLRSPPDQGVIIRVTLTDYSKGPDVLSFDEEDRFKFAMRRKTEATRLFAEKRFHLARERYRRILELFHHIDKPKLKERFDGKLELLQSCKDLRKACRLNSAACSLKVDDPVRAKEMCDAVLLTDPENAKGLYRRAQAHFQREDYIQACIDLRRLLDTGGTIEEARRLLKRATDLQKASDRKQRKGFGYNRMIDEMRRDPRSINHDCMDTLVDVPGVEGTPISAR